MTFQTKQEAMDAMESTRAEWLAAARAFAKQYASDGRTITINDIRRYGPDIPAEVDPRVCGAVFSDPDTWESLGYVKSTRRTAHGRPVCAFRLKGLRNG